MLWVESGVEWLPTVDDLSSDVSGAWLIDTHRGVGWRSRLAGAFDMAFAAQHDAVAAIRARGIPAEWLPLAAPSNLCHPGPDLDGRKYDVAFVGQCPPGSVREAVVAALRNRFTMAPVPGFLPPDKMMDLYRQSRIVVNIPWSGDLNMRTFEAVGARSLLVTGPAQRIDAVLPEDTFVTVATNDPLEWVQAVNRSLDDPDAQGRANEAFQHVVSHHTYDHRAARVLDVLGATRRREVSRQDRAAALAAAYVRWGRTQQVVRLPLSPARRLQFSATSVAWRGLIEANYRRRRLGARTTAHHQQAPPAPRRRATH